MVIHGNIFWCISYVDLHLVMEMHGSSSEPISWYLQDLVHSISQNNHSEQYETGAGHFNALVKMRYVEQL